jgi:sterol 3beta-glucosyltransferase
MTWTSTTTYPQAFASSIDLGPSYNLLSYSLFDSLIWYVDIGSISPSKLSWLTLNNKSQARNVGTSQQMA